MRPTFLAVFAFAFALGSVACSSHDETKDDPVATGTRPDWLVGRWESAPFTLTLTPSGSYERRSKALSPDLPDTVDSGSWSYDGHRVHFSEKPYQTDVKLLVGCRLLGFDGGFVYARSDDGPVPDSCPNVESKLEGHARCLAAHYTRATKSTESTIDLFDDHAYRLRFGVTDTSPDGWTHNEGLEVGRWEVDDESGDVLFTPLSDQYVATRSPFRSSFKGAGHQVWIDGDEYQRTGGCLSD